MIWRSTSYGRTPGPCEGVRDNSTQKPVRGFDAITGQGFGRSPHGSSGNAGPGRSERREMDEQNDDEQREQRSKDATEQPELTPSQNEQPAPARAAGRQTRFFTTSVCSHKAPRGVSLYLTPLFHSCSAHPPTGRIEKPTKAARCPSSPSQQHAQNPNIERTKRAAAPAAAAGYYAASSRTLRRYR
jgi:hypothetical protein